MKELRDAIPLDLISGKFNTLRKAILAVSTQEIKEKQPYELKSLLLYIWDEMVERQIVKDPYKIKPILNDNFNGIFEFIQTVLGNPPIDDVYSVAYYNEHDDDNAFINVTLFKCFPDDIHIAKVIFSDNSRPQIPCEGLRQTRKYHGLHIFPCFLSRLKIIARNQGAKRISLIVSFRELYPVFKKYGFELSKSKGANIIFNGIGEGFPMILTL